MIEIPIPDGVDVSVHGSKISIKGEKGTVERIFPSIVCLNLDSKENKIRIEVSDNPKTKPKSLEKTVGSHIRNMFVGVTQGYEKKLKILYSHFPFTMEEKNGVIVIKNFLGEKVPRYAKVFGNVKVKISKSEVVLQSPDKEALGNTYASLKTATKIKDKDPRVFQDGLYEIA